MGNAGSMDSQQTDFKAHNVPLKLPMPEPGELEERFAIVLVSESAAAGRGAPVGQAAQMTRLLRSQGRGSHLPHCGLPASLLSASVLALSRGPRMGRGARAGLPRRPRTHCLAGAAPRSACAGRCRVGVKGRWLAGEE